MGRAGCTKAIRLKGGGANGALLFRQVEALEHSNSKTFRLTLTICGASRSTILFYNLWARIRVYNHAKTGKHKVRTSVLVLFNGALSIVDRQIERETPNLIKPGHASPPQLLYATFMFEILQITNNYNSIPYPCRHSLVTISSVPNWYNILLGRNIRTID